MRVCCGNSINQSRPSFWMKGMLVSIDMVYLLNNKIIEINPHIPAPKTAQSVLPIYRPQQSVDGVLEMAGGAAERLGLTAGQEVTIDITGSVE